MHLNKKGNSLMVLAIIAVVVSLVAVLVAFSAFNNVLSIVGYATQGSTNLTIEQSANINFTTDNIDWGSGRHYPGSTLAHLTTIGGLVDGGNWTNVTEGFIIENLGNVNLTLNVTVGKSAANFIGGTGPGYWWNFTANEAGSCTNSTGGTTGEGMNLGLWNTTSTTAGIVCQRFTFEAAKDRVRIDINITIPENAPTGAKGDILTASAQAA